MDIIDLLVLITKKLLGVSTENFEAALAGLRKNFSGLEFDEPQKNQSYSVAAMLPHENILGYSAWLKELHARAFKSVLFVKADSLREVLSKIASVPTNDVTDVLILRSESRALFFVPEIKASRRTWIDGSELEALIDFQFEDKSTSARLWLSLLEKNVNTHMSFCDASSEQDVRQFLRRNFEEYYCPADDFLRTTQFFCVEHGREFKIPPQLAPKLQKYPDDFEQVSPPHVTESLSKDDVLQLVEAQGNPECWLQVQRQINWLFEEGTKPHGTFNATLTAEEMRRAFSELPYEDFSKIPMPNIVAALGREFKIPEYLQAKFTFPPKPLISEAELWRASPNPEAWQMYLFRFLGETNSSSIELGKPNLQQTLERFAQINKSVEEFALRVGSPFGEAFTLVSWILNADQIDFGDRESTVEALKASGFSEKAINVFSRALVPLINSIAVMTKSEQRIFLTLEVGNVFGGMGSWNDQYFENSEDQTYYESISRQLDSAFQELRRAAFSER